MAWETDNLGGQRAAGANIREDLSNMISNISRDETPFLSATIQTCLLYTSPSPRDS